MADSVPELSEWFEFENKLSDRMIKQEIIELDKLLQNFVLCQCLADQFFTQVLTKHDILLNLAQ